MQVIRLIILSFSIKIRFTQGNANIFEKHINIAQY